LNQLEALRKVSELEQVKPTNAKQKYWLEKEIVYYLDLIEALKNKRFNSY